MSDAQSDAIQYLAVLLARETKRADQLEVEFQALAAASEQQALALSRTQRDLEIASAHRDQWQNDARRQEQRADKAEAAVHELEDGGGLHGDLADAQAQCHTLRQQLGEANALAADRSAYAHQLEAQVAALQADMKGAIEDFLHDVTRFEVIDHRPWATPSQQEGRVYVAQEAKIDLDFQDDHRTLKVFVTDPPEAQPGRVFEVIDRLRGSE